MRQIILLLISLITVESIAQNTKVFKSVWVPEKGVYELKELTHIREYDIADGMVIEYETNAQDDTVRVYNYGVKTFKKKIIFDEVGTSPPDECPDNPQPPTQLKVEAESATTVVNAQKQSTNICCILPGAVITYPNQNLTGYTQMVVRYARANTGDGTVKIKLGDTEYTCSFGPTGGWSTWADKTFPIGGHGSNSEFKITSAATGPANFDYIIFK